MAIKACQKNRYRLFICYCSVLCILLAATLVGCTTLGPSAPNHRAKLSLPVVEIRCSDNPGNISIGLANINNKVSLSGASGIAANKKRILEIIDLFKKYKVNMVIFPEFSLTGYFWADSPQCWDYMRQGAMNFHLPWLAQVKAKLDDQLQYIIINNIRLNPSDPQGKFLNSTYLIDKNFDCENLNSESNEKYHIYDKTFLPGIEKKFEQSGFTDWLILDSPWGRFGFTTCYDMCFTQLFQEYAMFGKVDAFVQVASWRGTSQREYPLAKVRSDHYYGFIWDLMASSQAAFNQAWVIACNSVGPQKQGEYQFWGGSGLWAPSGMKLIQGSHDSEELMILYNTDIKKQVKLERDEFNYYQDFIKIYRPLNKERTFTRELQVDKK